MCSSVGAYSFFSFQGLCAPVEMCWTQLDVSPSFLTCRHSQAALSEDAAINRGIAFTSPESSPLSRRAAIDTGISIVLDNSSLASFHCDFHGFRYLVWVECSNGAMLAFALLVSSFLLLCFLHSQLSSASVKLSCWVCLASCCWTFSCPPAFSLRGGE